MAIIGVLARVDVGRRQQTVDHLVGLPGVETFSVGEDERIGILIEQPTFARARQTLVEQVESAPGVLCAWPVFNHFEEESSP